MGPELKHPEHDPLDLFQIGGQTLRYWYAQLTVDENGEYSGYLATPGSPYGRTGADCANWALALGLIYEDANGPTETPEAVMDEFMGLVVNGDQMVIELVLDYWARLPRCIRQRLGTKADLLRIFYL